MSKIVTAGHFKYKIRSWLSLLRISAGVLLRRITGKSLVASWSVSFEIGVLFWREQFNRALAMSDIVEGRLYFDSLQTYTDEIFTVVRKKIDTETVIGEWIAPAKLSDDVTVLYFHGGGYTFHGSIIRRFADGLATLLGRQVFSLEYRLTPEHGHPAQIDDAIASYRYLLEQGVDPSKLVIIGDSAGGHLALMTLQRLRDVGLPQPALVIGLCPWTDVGSRGSSLFENDRYDLVQGYMTLQFGEWLMAGSGCSREELSPIFLDYEGCAPIYLQAGDHEILHDMIKEFAEKLVIDQQEITLDVWQDMTHNFQAHGAEHLASKHAFFRMNQAITHYTSDSDVRAAFELDDVTVCQYRGK